MTKHKGKNPSYYGPPEGVPLFDIHSDIPTAFLRDIFI